MSLIKGVFLSGLAFVLAMTLKTEPVKAQPVKTKAVKAESLTVGNFSGGDLSGWQQKEFKGKSIYELVEQGGKRVLAASSNKSASALYKKISVDLNKTPYLHWSWQVDISPAGSNSHDLNPLMKSGDDYAARVYVVKRGLFPWQAKALNYVWLDKKRLQDRSKLTHWRNPFSDNAVMIPIQTQPTKLGEWYRFRVDVRADFKRYFNLDFDELDGVAIMTDSDNSGLQTRAYFGDVYFSN